MCVGTSLWLPMSVEHYRCVCMHVCVCVCVCVVIVIRKEAHFVFGPVLCFNFRHGLTNPRF